MSNCSEFEELEAVPTMAVMDGPLEPSSSAASVVTDAPDDPAFVNFFSVRTLIMLFGYSNCRGILFQLHLVSLWFVKVSFLRYGMMGFILQKNLILFCFLRIYIASVILQFLCREFSTAIIRNHFESFFDIIMV